MKITNWLKKPYPFLDKSSDKLILACSFGLFVFLFLLIFEPFGSDETRMSKPLFFLGFGCCTFLGLFFNYTLLPTILKKTFDPEKWKIGKEILFILWSFVLISALNYTYDLLFCDSFHQRSFVEFLGITTSIGLFPVIILTFILERKLNRDNSNKAIQLNSSLENQKINEEHNNQITITSENIKTAPLTINLNDFIFAKSDNNYTTVFYSVKNNLDQSLLRLSIKNLEKQLDQFSNIVRCHKSYLVNKQKIKAVKGNARSLILQIENYETPIPVSRSFPKEKLI